MVQTQQESQLIVNLVCKQKIIVYGVWMFLVLPVLDCLLSMSSYLYLYFNLDFDLKNWFTFFCSYLYILKIYYLNLWIAHEHFQTR